MWLNLFSTCIQGIFEGFSSQWSLPKDDLLWIDLEWSHTPTLLLWQELHCLLECPLSWFSKIHPYLASSDQYDCITPCFSMQIKLEKLCMSSTISGRPMFSNLVLTFRSHHSGICGLHYMQSHLDSFSYCGALDWDILWEKAKACQCLSLGKHWRVPTPQDAQAQTN